MNDDSRFDGEERGNLLRATEAWKAHGIDPPPLLGDPSNPEIVARVKESRARWAAMTEEEREARRREVEEFIARWDREHGWVDGAPPAERSADPGAGGAGDR